MPTPSGYTKLIATHIRKDVSDALLASGTLEVMATDASDKPITARAGGDDGGALCSVAVFTITGGALPDESYIADTSLTHPTNICYRFTVKDETGKKILVASKAQPSGETFDFDKFEPNVAPQALIQTGPTGPAGPDTAPTQYVGADAIYAAVQRAPQVIRITSSTNNLIGLPQNPDGAQVVYVRNETTSTKYVVPYPGQTISAPASLLNGSGQAVLPADAIGTMYMLMYDPDATTWNLLDVFSQVSANVQRYVGAAAYNIAATLTPQLLRFTSSGANGIAKFPVSPVDGQLVSIQNATGATLYIQIGGGDTVIPEPAEYATTDTINVPADDRSTYTYVYSEADDAWQLVGVQSMLPPQKMVQYVGEAGYNVPAISSPQMLRFTSLGSGDNSNVALPAAPIGHQVVYIKNETGSTLNIYGNSPTFCIFPASFTNHSPLMPANQWGLVWKFVYDGANGWRLEEISSPVQMLQAGGDLWTPKFSTNEFANRLTISDPSKNGAAPSAFKMQYSDRNYRSFGDSITAGAGASTSAKNYPSLVDDAFGFASFDNKGVGGDLSTDMAIRVFNSENAAASDKRIYTVAAGTNDTIYNGLGAGEKIFNLAHQACIAWLATVSDDRVDGGTVLDANWSSDTTFSAVTGAKSSTNGATNTYSITTHGGPLYIWSVLRNATAAAFSVTVDGNVLATVSCLAPLTIATPNGNSISVQLTRIEVPAGAHTVVITVTSATDAANVVSILALGTPGEHVYYRNPRVGVLGVLPQQGNLNGEINSVFTQHALDNVALFQADGLDVFAIDNRKPFVNGSDTSLYYDSPGLHPNDDGYALVAATVVDTLKIAPGLYVRRTTPPAGSKGTPGDVWSYGGKVYGVQADQSIQWVSLSGGTV